MNVHFNQGFTDSIGIGKIKAIFADTIDTFKRIMTN